MNKSSVRLLTLDPNFTEWSKASNSNVCYLTYAYEKSPTSIFKMCILTKRMLKSKRLQYAAKVARNLVLNIRERCEWLRIFGTNDCWSHMSQVTVVGFSFGAHIASRICIDLFQRTGEKVGKLIGEEFICSFDSLLIKSIIFNVKYSIIQKASIRLEFISQSRDSINRSLNEEMLHMFK